MYVITIEPASEISSPKVSPESRITKSHWSGKRDPDEYYVREGGPAHGIKWASSNHNLRLLGFCMVLGAVLVDL